MFNSNISIQFVIELISLHVLLTAFEECSSAVVGGGGVKKQIMKKLNHCVNTYSALIMGKYVKHSTEWAFRSVH